MQAVRLKKGGSPISIIGDAIQKVNYEVYVKSKSSPEYEGMGTTLVAAVIMDRSLYVQMLEIAGFM